MSKKSTAAAKPRTDTVQHRPIKSVHPDPHQPRKAFDEASLLALADNIKQRGILSPITVRQDGDKYTHVVTLYPHEARQIIDAVSTFVEKAA